MKFANTFLITVAFLVSVIDGSKDNDSMEQYHDVVATSNSNLRGGVVPDQSRLLQLLPGLIDQGVDRVCALIEEQFTGGLVSCDCTVQALTGFVGYTCKYTEPVCTPGSVCGTSTTSGSLDLVNREATAQVCFADIEGAIIPVGDVCVNVKYDLTRIGSGEAVKCTASVDGLICSSCNPCKGGISTDCSNVVGDDDDTTCDALEFVNGLRLGRRINRNKISPFIPSFLLE